MSMFTMKKTKILSFSFWLMVFVSSFFFVSEKNTDFIQGVLTFASIALGMVTTAFAVLSNSKLPSKLHFDSEYQYEHTTSWNIITSHLRQYMRQLASLIILALVTLTFPCSLKTDISFSVVLGDEIFFSVNDGLFYISNTLLWHIFLIFAAYIMSRTYSCKALSGEGMCCC
ncbi:hypothetical protein V4P56_02675 [Bartonella sp. B35(2025)]